MSENTESLRPGKYFPAELPAPEAADILAELARFGCAAQGEIRLIDSSHSADDLRLNYIVDRRRVLRLCSAPDMSERRIAELNRLIGRYRDFGLRCPAFIPDAAGRYLHDRNGLCCYLSEYVDLPLLSELPEERQDEIWPEVPDSVARFAEAYRDMDLSDTPGMYSLFDLNPFDRPFGVDEKQQNFNRLIRFLREDGQDGTADRLEARHAEERRWLLAVHRSLPRCFFQGDENASNVLVEDGHMAGLIDFNLAGTEVVVNQLANLGGGFDEEAQTPEGAEVRLRHALDEYRALRTRLLRLYHATETERQAMARYTWIALAAGWPQLCFFLHALRGGGAMKEEILALLELLAALPEEELLATD
ncbi:MAG: phosphotransferase [Oscillospiraceae bacterium]|nr:phosphotransferase [Oscillospiraceae bacterium]